MKIVIKKEKANLPALAAALEDALPDVFDGGLSMSPGNVVVYLADNAKPEDAERVMQIVTAHDAAILTAAQQAQAEDAAAVSQMKTDAKAVSAGLASDAETLTHEIELRELREIVARLTVTVRRLVDTIEVMAG